jgi:hypothetical protein
VPVAGALGGISVADAVDEAEGGTNDAEAVGDSEGGIREVEALGVDAAVGESVGFAVLDPVAVTEEEREVEGVAERDTVEENEIDGVREPVSEAVFVAELLGVLVLVEDEDAVLVCVEVGDGRYC